MLEETKKNLAHSILKKQELLKKEQALWEYNSSKFESQNAGMELTLANQKTKLMEKEKELETV